MVESDQIIQFFSCLLKFVGRFFFVSVTHYNFDLGCHRILYFGETSAKTSSLVCHVSLVMCLKVSCGTGWEAGAEGSK